jgi:hypothetical protein
MLSFLLAPLSPLVGERGWGIEGECKKLTLVSPGLGGLEGWYKMCIEAARYDG